jgi:recombinational DNA repair protein (RecF pathway)
MPDSNDNKLIVKLVQCSRCGNAFMIQKGQPKTEDLVCDNCLKLEERKKHLSHSVEESQKQMEVNIKDYKSQLRTAKSQQIKQMYFEKIKEQSNALSKSVELLKKIQETNDEKYIEEYKRLFEKMKEEYS